MTKEQEQELWEWCGFTRLEPGKDGYHFVATGKEWNWMAPGKTRRFESVPFLPRIDLNSLFKWAVPKLANYSMYKGLEPGVPVFGQHIAKVWSLTHGYGEAYSEDPADALFEAIYEVIHEKATMA